MKASFILDSLEPITVQEFNFGLMADEFFIKESPEEISARDIPLISDEIKHEEHVQELMPKDKEQVSEGLTIQEVTGESIQHEETSSCIVVEEEILDHAEAGIEVKKKTKKKYVRFDDTAGTQEVTEVLHTFTRTAPEGTSLKIEDVTEEYENVPEGQEKAVRSL